MWARLGMTSQVSAATINGLKAGVRSGSGHGAIVGPKTSRMSVITA
jgi:hypothetical protein